MPHLVCLVFLRFRVKFWLLMMTIKRTRTTPPLRSITTACQSCRLVFFRMAFRKLWMSSLRSQKQIKLPGRWKRKRLSNRRTCLKKKRNASYCLILFNDFSTELQGLWSAPFASLISTFLSTIPGPRMRMTLGKIYMDAFASCTIKQGSNVFLYFQGRKISYTTFPE